jgi:glycine hydroxymethyltransferase
MSDYRDQLKVSDPKLYSALLGEERRQQTGLELIPSENYTYPEVYCTYGTAFANKYSEGYPGRRYYGGQAFTDEIENLAVERANAVFRSEHANVQPLSGSPMNQAVYLAFLEPGDTILAMDLSHGGHLTHGAPVSHMGKIFNFVRYKTDSTNGEIDFDELMRIARACKPKMVLCGYTSYPRDCNYAEFRRIADRVGALAMADISHIGGLVAGGAMRNPIDEGFDVVTTTTHKSLRGPRAGIVLCKRAYQKNIDQSVFPGLQGGPHMNVIAGIAVTLMKAMQPEFRQYAVQVLANAQELAAGLLARGCALITGGTSNHMIVIDTVKTFGLDGHKAERRLDEVGMTVNKQVIPDDTRPPLKPSGIRLGTPAATTRGMGKAEMAKLANWITQVLRCPDDESVLSNIRTQVTQLCQRFPVPGLP